MHTPIVIPHRQVLEVVHMARLWVLTQYRVIVGTTWVFHRPKSQAIHVGSKNSLAD